MEIAKSGKLTDVENGTENSLEKQGQDGDDVLGVDGADGEARKVDALQTA